MALGWPRSWSSWVSRAFTARMVSLGSDAAPCRAAVRLSTCAAHRDQRFCPVFRSRRQFCKQDMRTHVWLTSAAWLQDLRA